MIASTITRIMIHFAASFWAKKAFDQSLKMGLSTKKENFSLLTSQQAQ
jgi:hypothetical protein